YLNNTFEISANGYAIITDGGSGSQVYQNFNVSENSIALYVDANSICGGLINTNNKTIILKNSTDIIDNITYQPIAKEGNSLCRIDDIFYECIPTPGSTNTNETTSIYAIILINLPDITIVNATYTSLFKIEIVNKKNCSIYDNATVFYNITNLTDIIKNDTFTKSIGCSATSNTGIWIPFHAGNFSICGMILNLTANNTTITNDIVCKNITVIDPVTCDLSLDITSKVLYENETIKYNLTVNDTLCNSIEHPIVIEYWIEDLFEDKKDYANITQDIICYKNVIRSWTPDDIIGSEGYYIKANITNSNCNDINYTNNFYKKLILFKGMDQTKNSYIRIKDVNSRNEAKYGESIDIELEIYKNSTNKYVIYLWVKDNKGNKLSEITKLHLKSKNTLYTIKIPVQLKPNCNHAYTNGNHFIVVEGLDLIAVENVSINGILSSVCQKEYITSYSSSSCKPCKTPEYEIIYYPDTIHIDEEFDIKVKISANETKNITLYSYVHKGNNLVSLGYNGERWLETWDANKQIIEAKTLIITLKNKIKNDIERGMYNLRVKIIDNKEHNIDKEIKIIQRPTIPNMTINKNNTSINISTDCEDCEIWIITPNDTIVSKNKAINFNATYGRYNFFLIKDSKIIQKKFIEVNVNKTEDKNIITGMFLKNKIDKQLIYLLLIKNIFSIFSFI
ncbi:MAG: hypothetical protein QXD48_03180, partial [Candidatus Aenigmatarchaeota archaeon]